MTLFDYSVREVRDVGAVRWSDPPTSRDAAAQVDVTAIRAAILAEFRRMAWLTDDELADGLEPLCRASVKTARSGLKRDGLLVDSGTKRPSNHGRQMIVWKLANR